MIITFCGHSNFQGNKEYEDNILRYLNEIIGVNEAEIYLGGYGGFDHFAHNCCAKYKKFNPNISLIFVSPYLSIEYQKNHLMYQEEKYDGILYANTENIPPRFAIVYRNRFMVEHADFVISYVSHKWGGAYKTYKYAKQRGKTIFNLASFDE